MSPQRLKRTIALVDDTECCHKNPKSHGLVYHFGAIMGNIEQTDYYANNDFIEMDYYVKEVMQDLENYLFTNKEQTPYAINRSMEKALKDAFKNPHKVKSWKEILREFDKNIKSCGVEYITSYNFNFDIGKERNQGTIRRTQQQLRDKSFYLPRGVEYFCLMDIVANCMANRDFKRWIDTLDESELNQMTTEKGNLSFSAQTMLRYHSKDLYYIEQHTALRDARLEFRLLMECWKNWKNIIKRDFVNNVKAVSFNDFKNGISMTKKLQNRKNRKRKTKKAIQQEQAKQLELSL